MYRQAVTGYEKAFGADNFDTLTSVSCLGTLLAIQGKYDQAETMYRQVLTGYEKGLGTEHSMRKLKLCIENFARAMKEDAQHKKLFSVSYLGSGLET